MKYRTTHLFPWFATVLLPNVLLPTVLLLASVPSWAQEALSKTGTALGTGSTTEVVGGDTVRWVIDYENLSGGILDNVRVDDPVGANQDFVPGSLEVPSPWQALYSTDGMSYSTTEPAGVTHLRAVADRVPDGALGDVVDLPPPLAELAMSASGGDGTLPILYEDRIFMIFHHEDVDGSQINCIERLTSQVCAGYPYTFESTPGPGRQAGNGFGDVATTYWPEQDDQLIVNGSQLLYGAQRQADWGLGCWDLETASNCGYTQLSATGMATSQPPAMFEGPLRIGDRLYFADFENAVHCYDLGTSAACPGYPIDVADAAEGMPDYDPGQLGGDGVIMGLQVVGERLYFMQNYRLSQGAAGTRLTCFDTVAEDRCAGWTSVFLTGSNSTPSSGSWGLYTRRTAAGVPDAICSVASTVNIASGGTGFNQCFDLATSAPVPAPAGLSAVISALDSPGLQLELEVGTRTYFPLRFFTPLADSADNNWQGHTICYDWSLDAICPGFDLLDGANDGIREWVEFALSNPDVTQDYGYASDGNCLFGLGNSGLLWSFDPETGATPCQKTSVRFTTTPPEDFFCDGESHTVTWDQVTIEQVDLTPGVELSSLTVEVFDAAGTTSLLGPIELVGNPGAHPVDISGIPFGPGTETLVVEVRATTVATEAWDDGEPPLVVITFDTDAGAQICFETQVPDVCDTIVGPIVNTATTSRGASASASLDFLENVETCPQCPTCETDPTGGTVTVFVDEDVTVDFNPFRDTGDDPTCDDGVTPDLCDFFAFDVSGATPETWRAIFDLGGRKLVVRDNATVTMVNVPPSTNSQDAPGFELVTTCEILVEGDLDGDGEPGTIAIDALNGNTGDIVLQADGEVRIDGHVRNTNGGTRNKVGDIRIGSCCGGVVTGAQSRIETENHIDAGDIDIVACCGSDVVIGGLVRAVVAIPPAPTIRVIAFEGSVTIDGTSDLGLETVAGAKVRRTSGLLAQTLNRATSGRIYVQAQGDVTVIGREVLSGNKQNGAVAIRSREGGELVPDAEIRVISLMGRILGIDRAFDVGHRFAGGNTIRLEALGDVDLSVTNAIDFGAGDRRKPVLDARGGKGTSAAGGTNAVRSFQGNVIVGEDVQLLADAVGGTANTGGTNTLDARDTGSGQVTIAAGAEILAGAGGTDGSNEIDACQVPSIDPSALVDPIEDLALECLVSETPSPLTDPATGQPLVCEDLGFVFSP